MADDYYAPGATDPRHIVGLMGEELLAKHLRERGFVVFRDWRKPVNAGGIDLCAFDRSTGRLWYIDNKAQLSDIRSPSALSRNFDQGAAGMRTFLERVHPNKAEADLALKAIRATNTRRVVANALAGETSRFSASVFAQGLDVYDVRFARLFTAQEHASWATLHSAIGGRKGVRTTGVRGAATVGSQLLVLAVSGAILLVFRGAGEWRSLVGEQIGQLALGAILSRLPGGFIASMTIGLESDETESVRRARKRMETIYQILGKLPPMSEREQEESVVSLGHLLDEPLPLPEPQSYAQPRPVVPTPAPVPGPSLPPFPPPR